MKWDKLVIATRNRDKVREIQDLLKTLPVTILSINDFDHMIEVVEDQPTLQANAIKKATEISAQFDMPALADDTGLEVDALDGAPGVFSSRFAGPQASYDENVDLLLHRLNDVPKTQRAARFRTVMALAFGNEIDTVEGVCDGTILQERRGSNGFGYDPVFYVPEFEQTLAEMDLAHKNKISHRAKALQNMKDILQQKFGA